MATFGVESMATYVLIHGAGDVGWYWHLVAAELRERFECCGNRK